MSCARTACTTRPARAACPSRPCSTRPARAACQGDRLPLQVHPRRWEEKVDPEEGAARPASRGQEGRPALQEGQPALPGALARAGQDLLRAVGGALRDRPALREGRSRREQEADAPAGLGGEASLGQPLDGDERSLACHTAPPLGHRRVSWPGDIVLNQGWQLWGWWLTLFSQSFPT